MSKKLLSGIALCCAVLTVSHACAGDSHIVADPTIPNNQRPQIINNAGGLAQVNINTPNGGGLSYNRYQQFDVGQSGAILNNSGVSVQTQLGGLIAGNPNLLGGSARLIVNEVNSPQASQLNGFVEVAGARADVVIANPSGINVAGGGFINANRATLTTGTPIIENGALTGYDVRGGSINVSGDGLDFNDASYADIITRSATINADVWANNLQVITGENWVSHDGSLVESLDAETGVSLDVGALGGMYANQIRLVGTGRGVGVNTGIHNKGEIVARVGEVVINADGSLVNSGTINGKSGVFAEVGGEVVNDAAARIKSNGSVDIFSERNIDNSGEIIAGKNSEISGRSVTNSGTVQSRKNMTVWAESGDVTNAGAFFAGGNAKFSIAGAMTNQGGTVSAGDKLVMAVAAGVSNTGDIVADKSLITAGGLFHNTGSVDGDEVVLKVSSLQNYSTGTIQGDYLAVQAGSIMNGLPGTGTGTSGRLGARVRLDLGATTITNREDGLLYSDGDIFVGGSLDGNNQATGSASSLLNSSAVIDVAGSIHAAVGHFQNINDHYATELREVKRETYQGYRLPGASMEEIWIPENDPSTHWDGGEWAQIHGQWVEDFFIHNGTVVEYDTFVTSSRPGFVYTGGDLTVTGSLTNNKSRIISSRTVSATGGFNNISAIEPYIVKESGNFHYTFVTATGWTGRHKRVFDVPQSYVLPDVITYNEKDVVLDGQ